MATFSWGDTARAAFATCFACFPQYQQSTEDDDSNNNNNNNNNQRNANRDELESLLRSTEHSDGEMDTDAVSLHSNVGNPRRKDLKRQKQRRRRRKHNSKGTIRLFGYDLFGKPAVGQAAEGYSDEDDGDDDDDDDSERRRISRLSSSTLDSDPMPVEDDTIARLSAGRTRRPSQSRSQVEVAQPSQTQDEEASAAAAARKAARKEKRRQRKLSSALLNAEQSVEFEGFQGSGGDGDTSSHAVLNNVATGTGTLSPSSRSSSSGLPLQEEFGAFQEANQQPYLNNVALSSPSRTTTGDGFVRVSRNDVEDEADNNADFDAVAYIRRNSIASRSDSGSGSRSHTSVSMSRSEGIENARIRELQSQGLRSPSLLHDPRQHPLSPSELVPAGTDKPSKRTRRSTTSGLDDADQPTSPSSRKPRRSRRSTTAGSTSGTSSSTTTTMSSSQPRSPDSLPTSDLRIVQPSDHHNHNHNHNHLRPPQHSPAFEGVPEDEGEFTGSPLPSPFRSPASDLSKGLPSPGLSTATLGGSNGFPSVGFGGRRGSSATASSGAFLARTGDDS